MENKKEFIEKAESLKPQLINHQVHPISIIEVLKEPEDWSHRRKGDIANLNTLELGKDDSVCLDFGTHHVGFISLKISANVSGPDAPAYIRLKFGEHICEIAEDSAEYQGTLSSAWIQEEYIHIDVFPAEIKLPRRYAFRFLEIYVKDTSPRYKIILEHIACTTVTSANVNMVEKINHLDKDLIRMDEVAVKTMQDCMQNVFEDGPKRDRRLWLGDLRLQALVNYKTFKNYDLVKRCLYLFAGLSARNGQVSACLYTEPAPIADDIFLYDYSLFFISCLYDYYEASGDRKTLIELWDTAYRQIEIAAERVDEDGIVRDSDDWWCFLDWNKDLNKQAGAQAVFIYTLKQAKKVAETLSDSQRLLVINQLITHLCNGARNILWDTTRKFFASGANRQISYASQVWFVLAEVFDKNQNAELLKHLIKENPSVGMVTPYMYHHFIEALIQSDMKDEALQYLRSYWGAMVKDGADCFYEVYDPNDKYASPYGSRIINSYCHAWSGTPAYFIRKYYLDK
uniref:Alpha-L-rhamnosidase n=1 Tax=uncultured Bacillota bacterium TaxID=344338 RepID=A0A650EMW4_9FIRM|nr:alpha-L-rhamnosidase [uncultured Firmicutes bacterium]